jgi:hypothetical protein
MQPMIAFVWFGDSDARQTSNLETSRFAATANAFRRAGFKVRGVVYNDQCAEMVRDELLECHAVQVWVNPLMLEGNRTILDAMLREVAAAGVQVNTHPDIILKLGTKEVLYQTRHLSWGVETFLYQSSQALADGLKTQLQAGKTRVLKQYRGNDGIGVWKIAPHPENPELLRLRHASKSALEQEMDLPSCLALLEPYMQAGGKIIDQAFQDSIREGMVRCYLVGETVAGFGFQKINALHPTPFGATPPTPTARDYFSAQEPQFQTIRAKMQQEWLPALCAALELPSSSLPLLWDVDLILSGTGFVLCEINVSSVYPFPEAALEVFAAETKQRLVAHNPNLEHR